MNANEIMQRTLDEMKSRLVGSFTDPDELLEALGGSYEVIEVVPWAGGYKQHRLRGANGREASVFGATATVYEAAE